MRHGRMEQLATLLESDKYGVDMERWHNLPSASAALALGTDSAAELEKLVFPGSCKTTHCIAGACQMEFATTAEQRSWHAGIFTRRWLGLNAIQAVDLFHIGNWPGEYMWRYQAAISSRARGKVCAELIRGVVRKDKLRSKTSVK